MDKAGVQKANSNSPTCPEEHPISDDAKTLSAEPETNKTVDAAFSRTKEMRERFKALQARAKNATERNLKETAAESQRLATDPSLLSSISRKHAFASHNLLKADTESQGEDFERKRAWDWTIDESEKWDKRMEKKQRHRDDTAFQDYRQDARKIYKRQMRQMQPDLEAYEKEKILAVEKAAASGGLQIVEAEDGELVAVDKNGTFYSTADSVDFAENKPDRAAVDRLVADLRKAEEIRLKKRKDRGRGDEEDDVTYINDQNKKFNQQLARFYNKYTAEIRDSFERGTMI
ncbi:pre-mRNA-splicing factor syf2 [Blastomyces dermatitidis]|uniref:Pre-mRNA-splicing factor SYF2 n=3 Tax=Blastomyces TaxID=229219 RepID=A0A179UVI5_BLAGS|nr:pre-mRNA-splicing factor syf2 [Blastomyces gilchristii SLH14081]XP_045277331.1 pre-mRNA-splicing factor syf2 [Blastomyces dermatitidis ER-3]EGE81455.1 pre-mRNA-splicing factor syf2 [Blastomyces dermatitidis ATCC 18188]EQL35600.1 pre-mRNA-splicing factor syf2 [Blastomyces dermatitidis ATCC 26199]EEQ90632.1 pre-mRNA-splicing factor syf2 [Blastomyces dermatitidis ER-3]OAT11158.1 pre-mRNA-splicing factor syf2 [Blastomyces gilchristii SLH14081]